MGEKGKNMSYLEVINSTDSWPDMDFVQATYADDPDQALYRFLLPGDDRPHGFLRPFVVAKMPWTSDFVVSGPDERPRTVRLVLPDLTEGRNGDDDGDGGGKDDPGLACGRAFEKLSARMIAEQSFPEVRRPHGENRVILGAHWRITFERSISELFGFSCEGVHLNMYVRDPEPAAAGAAGAGSERLRVWVGRRAMTVRTHPGMLDSTAGGAIMEDHPRLESMAREAWEEAGVPEEVVRTRARAAGAVSFITASDGRGTGGTVGLVACCHESLFDMEVGESEFAPASQDASVAEFRLMDMGEVKAALGRGEFKDSAAMVILAFMVRHGVITPDNEPDYAEINARLTRKMPMPTRWGTWLETC